MSNQYSTRVENHAPPIRELVDKYCGLVNNLWYNGVWIKHAVAGVNTVYLCVVLAISACYSRHHCAEMSRFFVRGNS